LFDETSLMMAVQITTNIVNTPTDIILGYCGHTVCRAIGKTQILNGGHIPGHLNLFSSPNVSF
jgi:hypothetical protein